MATRSANYGTRAQLTISPQSIAAGAFRESTEVDNSSTLAIDGELHGKIMTGTSPAANGTITVYVSGSDGTTTRPGTLTGTDSTITPAGQEAQFEVARIIPCSTSSNVSYPFFVGSIATLFGGAMPKKFSVIVKNGTSVALNATGGNHEIWYTPLKEDIA